MWTVELTATKASPDQLVERLAINFGAPGDRRQARWPVVDGVSCGRRRFGTDRDHDQR